VNSRAERPRSQVALDNLTSRSIRGKVAAMWTPLNGRQTPGQKAVGACDAANREELRAFFAQASPPKQREMILLQLLGERRKEGRGGRAITVTPVDRVSALSAMLSASSHSSFRSSARSHGHAQEVERPAVPRHSHRGHSAYLFLSLPLSLSPRPSPSSSTVLLGMVHL